MSYVDSCDKPASSSPVSSVLRSRRNNGSTCASRNLFCQWVEQLTRASVYLISKRFVRSATKKRRDSQPLNTPNDFWCMSAPSGHALSNWPSICLGLPTLNDGGACRDYESLEYLLTGLLAAVQRRADTENRLGLDLSSARMGRGGGAGLRKKGARRGAATQ